MCAGCHRLLTGTKPIHPCQSIDVQKLANLARLSSTSSTTTEKSNGKHTNDAEHCAGNRSEYQSCQTAAVYGTRISDLSNDGQHQQSLDSDSAATPVRDSIVHGAITRVFISLPLSRMTSSFPATSSAPPGTSATRVVANSPFTRILTSNANQASAQRGKAAFENRRSSNVATPYKRTPPAPITSNPRNTSILSRIEMVPLPATHIGLQQQMSSPGRLQRQPPLSPSSSQYVLPATALLDPPFAGRSRAAPLRPANIRNAIHRNAISLNALAMNNQNGTTARGRSQNSAHKGAAATRITRIRQQSLAASDLQPPNLPYSSATVIYRHPTNPDPPPVFFE